MNSRYWDEPSSIEILFTILNYVACIPVLLAVGGFSLYHLYCLLGNSTTIEGWEKDKVATLVRRGKLHEVKFPYNLGRKRNIESVLGKNIFLWCWPRPAIGNGLKYEMIDSDDGLVIWPPHDTTALTEVPEHDFILPSSPWTYENGDVNPDLRAFNAERRASAKRRKRVKRRAPGESPLPPYHPDYREQVDKESGSADESSNDEYDAQGPLVRTGSEGYEVRPVDREEVLRRYLAEMSQEQGRYKYYIPAPDDGDSESDSDTPLPIMDGKRSIPN
ncbi:hypothetical protein H2248_001184 [Termitomyces sp. 'cryptogamus']|nr:hypothetical protein H2248_001184 [Termitomyces sp. 'cryptogamus']